jgi:hypothetical protein
MALLAFDADDLSANRTGRISEGQSRRLGKGDRSNHHSALRSGVLLLLLGIAGPVAALIAGIRTRELAVIVSFGIPFGLIWPVIWIGVGYRTLRDAFKVPVLKVASARGRARILRHNSPAGADGEAPGTDYELQIGDQKFDVEPAIARVITPGNDYIVYYVEATGEILSAEGAGGGS